MLRKKTKGKRKWTSSDGRQGIQDFLFFSFSLNLRPSSFFVLYFHLSIPSFSEVKTKEEENQVETNTQRNVGGLRERGL